MDGRIADETPEEAVGVGAASGAAPLARPSVESNPTTLWD